MIGLIKTIKGKYRNGVIEPMEILEIPDGVEVTVIIDTTSLPSEEMKAEDWRRWRGVLTGTSALQNHEREHRQEVKGEESP